MLCIAYVGFPLTGSLLVKEDCPVGTRLARLEVEEEEDGEQEEGTRLRFAIK